MSSLLSRLCRAYLPHFPFGIARPRCITRHALMLVGLLLCTLRPADAQTWAANDIGNVGVSGSTEYDAANDVLSVKAGGTDIGGVADGFRFVHAPASGNVQVVAQVQQFVGTHPWARAGVMIRQGVNANAPFVAVVITQKYGVQLLSRASAGDSVKQTPPVPPTSDAPATVWLKLVRTGNTFRAFRSANGTDWTQAGIVSLTLGAATEVGVALTSHDTGTLAAAKFVHPLASVPVFGTALLGTADAALTATEQTIKARLQDIGYQVQTKRGASITPADAVGKSILIIPDTTVADSALGAVTTPLVTWSPKSFATLGLTGSTIDADFGVTAKNEEAVAITAPDHPLAAGFTGTLKVASPHPLSWGRPTAGAMVIATGKRSSTDDEPTLFAYDVGALTGTGQTPARHVGLFLTSDVIPDLRDEGWALFEAAIAWAANVPPSVAIVAPPFGAVVTQGNPVTFQATASDPDGTIVAVQFWVNGTKLAEVTHAPYTAVWTNPVSGLYTITAVAIDNRNGHTNSDPVTIIVNAPPTATITSPADGAVFQYTDPVPLAVAATDIDGTVRTVSLFDGAHLLGNITTTPYAFTWTTAALGNHTLTATATDNFEAIGRSTPVRIFVNAPPIVTLTSPLDGAILQLGRSVGVSAAASDADGVVTNVDFLVDDALIGHATTAPFSITWTSATAGNHTLKARALDNNQGTSASTPVHVVVNAPPVVTLAAPVNAAVFSVVDKITLTANATDVDGQVLSVEFDVDGQPVATLAAPPYTYDWKGATPGSHAIVAKAIDNLQGTASTSPVNISVVTDKDGDGLPDAWEVAHFGNLGAGPNDDPDGDGLTNLREYQTGRDPNVADPDAVVLAPQGILLWLRGDRGIDGADGASVTKWADQSGNANDAVATNNSERPVLHAGQANGLPVVRFDGVDDKLGVNLQAIAGAGYTILAVHERASAKAPGNIFGGGPNGVATFTLGYSADTSATLNYGGTPLSGSATAFSTPVFSLLEATANDSGHELLKNGKTIASDTTASAAPALTPAFVGGDGQPNDAFAGDIAELVVYRGAMDDATRSAIEKYLITRYNIKTGGDPKPGDIDGDGLLDVWEMKWFGNLDHDGDEDADGDGLTNLQEMQQGTDPTDYYNGQAPILAIVGGNGQSGIPGEFLPQPLTVKAVDAHGRVLANAPLTFSLTAGTGGLAATFGATATGAVLTRTDASGIAKAFFQTQTSEQNTTSVIETAATVAGHHTAVLFTERAPAWFPDSDQLVVEVNQGETITREISLTNPTANVVSYNFNPATASAATAYHVTNSDQAGGPTYQWNDIRTTGTWLKSLTILNEGSAAVDLSFAFPYYGQSFTRMFVGIDGYITFDRGAAVSGGGDVFPSPFNMGNSIAPYWQDLTPSSGGEVYVQDFGDHVVVQWDGMIDWLSKVNTFQAILYRNGTIVFAYNTLGAIDSALIGMQNVDGTDGISIQDWEKVVKPNYAVQISPVTQWLAVSPAAGRLSTNERQVCGVTYDATRLTAGTYRGQVTLQSNYPGKEAVVVTATMVVNGAPTAIITAPARTKRVIANHDVTLSGTGTDADGRVAKLEFYDGATKLGESAVAPLTITFNSAAIGEHTITLKVTDDKGAVTTSQPLSVFVDSDSDGDGIGDEWEQYWWGGLTVYGTGDRDADGVTDRQVYELGFYPYNTDEDGDGLSNKFELDHGLDPFTPESADDPDHDGFPTIFEILEGTDPFSAGSVPTPDYVVDPSGGGTHTTLQAALSAAGSNFKTILVKPGVYKGASNTGLSLRNVILIAAGNAGNTVIDGEGVNSGLQIRDNVVLRGFTIRNCLTSGLTMRGDGMQYIDNCLITGCTSTATGGGIYMDSTDAVVTHCTIFGNHAYDRFNLTQGSGLYVAYGRIQLRNSIVWNDAVSDVAISSGILLATNSDVRETVTGNNILHVDPRLTPDGHLQPQSPMRGAGAVLPGALVDLDGEARPVGAAPDIGADQLVDTDSDGLPDAWELRNFNSLVQAANGDPDGDGLDNLTEYNFGTSPTVNADTDGDGLTDAQEILVYHTDPLRADTDGDGMPDKWEVDNGLKPTVADAYEDADGDGYPNLYEFKGNTAANDPTSVPAANFTVDLTGANGAFTTLQAAINAETRDYQIIKVKPGVYKQSLSIFRYRTLLISTDGAATTIIDGERIRGGASVSADSALVGFTFRNGFTERGNQGNGVSFSNGSFSYHAQSVLENCVFVNNHSLDGGAVVASSPGTFTATIRHCTFVNNEADEGGGALLASGNAGVQVNIVDSILWDKPGTEISTYLGNVTVSRSIVRGGYPGTDVSAADPLVTPSGHLQAASPARGRAGTPLYRDLDNELAPAGTAPDLGADQFIDSDQDGLADAWELKNFGSLTAQSGGGDPDNDGLTNAQEYAYDTNPSAATDTDGDGLSDAAEIGTYHTDPAVADTDGDGMPDALEIQWGLDPLRDDALEDADGDGYPNIFEAMRGSDPHNAASIPAPDYTVAPSGAMFTSLSAATSAASNSGQNFRIILVSPGTYSVPRQAVGLNNQRILLISSGGAAQTIIDGGNVSYALAGLSVTTRSAVHGFTIRGMSGGRAAINLIADARLSNCVIRNNSNQQAAGVLVSGIHASIVNCTIFNNTATGSGSGMAVGALSVVDLVNSIVWNPGSASEIKGIGHINVVNSIVRDAIRIGGGIDTNPLLTADGHLRFLSPARSAGAIGRSPLKDMDGELRPVGAAPDIGADQFSGLGSSDADEDGMLDSWEAANGLNPLKNDALDDADGDGVPNIYEFAHNTNPQSSSSVPAPDLVVDPAPGAADPAHGVYATLQDAVAALTKPNQIIELRPGTYAGGISLAGANAQGVWIRSSGGTVRTIIDGAGTTFGMSASADALMSGLTFAHCSSDTGAALYADASHVRAINCVFRDNTATGGPGGAIYASAATVQLVHCSVFNNTAPNGIGAGVATATGTVRISNSIVWDSAANVAGGSDIEGAPASTIVLHSSLTTANGHYTDGGGNVFSDPQLAPATGHLAANSPAIDAGDPGESVAFDFEGDARPNGPRPDIGADEFVDSDGDGLNDGWERANFGDLSQDGNGDPDGDGLTNREEFLAGTSPKLVDTDGDGLTDFQEVRTYHTNPRQTDTDGDGRPDGEEIAKGLDPLQDDAFADSDSDGMKNLAELQAGTNPQNPDTDGDGLEDGLEGPAGLNPLVKDYVGPDITPPPTPGGLAIGTITPHTVQLSWTPVTDASAPVQYEIWRNDLLVDTVTDATYADEYGDPGVYAFTYAIVAVDAQGNRAAPTEKVSGSTAAGFTPLPGDADGDGIPDAVDARPNDPSNAFEDDDGDGIPNVYDANPSTYDGPPPYAKILNNDDKVDYVVGETQRLTIRVSDPGAKVVIYRNETPIGKAHLEGDIFVYELSWPKPGLYHLKAIATDSKNARLATKTFQVDVSETEAHITFVGPHPLDSDFGKDYSIKTQIDGAPVTRPILRNTYNASHQPIDFNQFIDVHYEHYYRGTRKVEIYRNGKSVCDFTVPAIDPTHPNVRPYVMVVLWEYAPGKLKPFVIDPSTPDKGTQMLKVANFGAGVIYGGFTPYFAYGGGGDYRYTATQAMLQNISTAFKYPVSVPYGNIRDMTFDPDTNFLNFYELGDYGATGRTEPTESHYPEFPESIFSMEQTNPPLWQAWVARYGGHFYNFYSSNSAVAPGDRVLYCYYRPSKISKGIEWISAIPTLPEIRITPYNVGTLAYPGGRGHPVNNLAPFNIPLPVNDDSDTTPGVQDLTNAVPGPNDDDIVTVNVRVDLRNQPGTKIRIQLPHDGAGKSVVRGFYDNGGTPTPLPGDDFVWVLSAHPDLLSDTGQKFYFEGLVPQLNARIKFDVLNDNDVPISRIFPTQGDPEMLRLDVVPSAHLLVDADRSGTITDATTDSTTPTTPYRFWVNDDIDVGDVANESDGHDIPGQGVSGNVSGFPTGADYRTATDINGNDTGSVQGSRDLVDYFPVYLDIKQLLMAIPPGADVKYKLKQLNGAVNLVYTSLTHGTALDFQKKFATTGFGPALTQPAQSATKYHVTAEGIDIFGGKTGSPAFLGAIQNHDGGVLLIDGRTPTSNPLILSVEKSDGTVITEVKLYLNTSPVEEMFRHLNLHDRNLPGLVGSKGDIAHAQAMGDPAGFRDNPNSDDRWLIFVHGFNVSGQASRGWLAEMFKRCYWSRNKSRFVGVSWFGSPDQVLGAISDYHLSVRNAMVTAPVLAQEINALPGAADGKTMFSHSLGCGVISSAIADYGMNIGRVCFVDAALARECFDGRNPDTFNTENDGMRPAAWKNYDPKLYAANWYRLFDPTTDARSKLTWTNRFTRTDGGQTDASPYVFHFYSSTEDVLAEYTGELPSTFGGLLWAPGHLGTFGWVYQEKGKGNRQNYLFKITSDGVSALTHLGSYYGGWGFNLTDPADPNDPIYYVADGSAFGLGARNPDTTVIGSTAPNWQAQFRRAPLFDPGYGPTTGVTRWIDPSVLRGPTWIPTLYDTTVDTVSGSRTAAITVNRDELLAEAIPALTWCMGSHKTFAFGNDRNFDLPSFVDKTNWPRGKPDGTNPEWRHSDMREVAYLFESGVFDKIVAISKPSP